MHDKILEAEQPLDDDLVYGNRGVAGIALGRAPITTTAPLFDRDRPLVHVLPAKSDQFAHSQPGVDRNKNHRGVRFRDEFHESRKLIRFDEGLERLPPLAGGKPQALDGVVHEQAVAFGGAENAGQYVANLVLRFVAKWKLSQSRQVLLQREWSQLAEAHFSERRREGIFDEALVSVLRAL